MISFSSFPCGMLYIPPLGSSATSSYLSMTLDTNHIFPESVSGLMTSYSINRYKTENTSYYCGISITFTFQNGYKIYNIYDESLVINFVSVQSFPRVYPLTTYVSSDSEAVKEAYDRGSQAGYNNGYDVGKSDGYSNGYSVGYNEGREAPQYSFKEFFLGFGNAFVSLWKNILSFDFLGVNLAGLVGSVLVVIVILFVLKLIGKS